MAGINVAAVTKSLSANGTGTGYATFTSTQGFYVGARVWLTSSTQDSLQCKIISVSPTLVGLRSLDSTGYGQTDLSDYLTADSAALHQPEQTVFGYYERDLGPGDSDSLTSDGSNAQVAVLRVTDELIFADGTTMATAGGLSEPITLAQVLTSDVASGSNAIKFSVSGARLCLGNNARYLTDSGSAIAVTGPVTLSSTLVATGLITSNVASGSNAIKFTTAGARLSLGSDARYLTDSGSALAMTGPVTASSTLDVTGAASAASLTAASLTATTGSTLSVSGSIANGAAAIAHKFGNANTLSTSGAKIASFYSDNFSTEKVYIDKDGLVSGAIFSASTRLQTLTYGDSQGIARFEPYVFSNGGASHYSGRATDGATAIGHRFGNASSLTTSGAKIVAFFSDALSTEKASISKDGKLSVDSTDSSGTPGNVTINKPAGRAAIAAGASAVTVTNSTVAAASQVLVTPIDLDTTLLNYKVVPAAGSFTITGNANATANWKFMFMVVG